mgnify:CR=1 FL=1
MVKFKQRAFLKYNSPKLGTCKRRGIDFAIIQLDTEAEDGIDSGDLHITKGDTYNSLRWARQWNCFVRAVQ